jgi:hypothetical protein
MVESSEPEANLLSVGEMLSFINQTKTILTVNDVKRRHTTGL